MIKLENMTLPSGRKLVFDCDYRDTKCRLLSSNGNYIAEGKGWSRIDALWMLYCDRLVAYGLERYTFPMREATIAELVNRHDRYHARILNELWELHNEARQGIPKEKPRKADPWEVVR